MKMIKHLAQSKSIQLIVTLAALSATVSCTSQGTIGGLQQADLSEINEEKIDKLDHQQVRDQYQELLTLVDDEYIKEQIERRISGVHMLEGDSEQSNENTAPKQGYYRNAIASYRDILEKYPNSPDNVEVLYQLAKAYDMEGQTQNALKMLERLVDRHPYYTNMAEVYFRIGDIYFNSARYHKAELAYFQTTQRQEEKLNNNAHYMLAWSFYKQGIYQKSLHHFALVLDQLLMAKDPVATLNNVEKSLVNDTLHSMSLALINLGGAEAIQDIVLLNNKTYVWQLYRELAQFYLEKSLYNDSAATYASYIERYPNNSYSNQFHQDMIQVYVKGAFPKLVLEEKERYSNLYGPRSQYFSQHQDQHDNILKQLQGYYIELASHYHSVGQQALNKSKQRSKNAPKEDHLIELSQKSLAQATQFYGLYLTHFNSQKDSEEIRFKKAEAHFENTQFALAAHDYDVVGYGENNRNRKTSTYSQKSGYTLANKAAYANIVAHQKHLDTLKEGPEVTAWRTETLTSLLKFASTFHNDERSVSVLTNASQTLFALNEYDQAIKIATELVNKAGPKNQQLKKTAYGIIAQSYFKKAHYQLAQTHYIAQRKLTQKNSAEYKDISQPLAAATYKQAELWQDEAWLPQGTQSLTTAQRTQKAIATLLSLKQLAPNTHIRIIAQYDASSLMLVNKQWDNALVELKDLKATFPKHELAAEFPRKIAFAYENKQDWPQALVAYQYLMANDPSDPVRQEALFIAAGLAEKTNNNDQAIEYYRDYAHKYEKPFDNRMEARFHLASLYEKKKDNNKQLFWLRRVIEGDAKGGADRTERSQWLGAWANAKYGDYFAWEFYRRSLRAPIDKSIARKNSYLTDANKRYTMAADYGMLEFVSMANVKMADLYEKFSQELLTAPIPKEASAEEKALYTQIFSQQAAPFTELAQTIHHNNIELGWQGHFNTWIEKSFSAMRRLSPERFDKTEAVARYGDEIL
ncbi:MAG: tetratricopeptide (TPR) repeat protein [Oleispira sp.]|jgi:tetratricopeptide (TPR) repeat protein